MGNSQAMFNILHDFVYEGIWENYSKAPFRRWIWTLKDSKAFLCLACLSILITVTETRAWVLGRYFIYQRTKSPMLEDDINRDYRQTLSQGRAIAESLPSLKILAGQIQRKFRHMQKKQQTQDFEPNDPDWPVTSPWFGIFALLNMILFITIGVLLPWVLSDGSLEAPVVKSKITENCLTALKYQNVIPTIQQLPQTDAILQQCLNRLDDVCNTQFYLRQPIVRKQRIASCPFPSNICLNSTIPVEMTHWNVTAYEVGVNSQAKLIMNHRLSCAPIDLGPLTFYVHRNTTPVPLIGSIITAQAETRFFSNYSMALKTLNGPHESSKENSGQRMAKENGPFDLTVLPSYFADLRPELFHPKLRRTDASPFLVIFRAGAAQNPSPVDDPFFSAHSQDLNHNNSFVADHEATGLGCAEQFQFCRADYSYCTEWGVRGTQVVDLDKHPLLWPDEASLAEILTLFSRMHSMFGVWEYLAIRIKFHGLVPLTRSMHFNWVATEEELWVKEVETWFMKGILNAILSTRYGAQYPLSHASEHFDIQARRKYSLCGRILFRDVDYTNLNWLGLCITTSLLLLICLVSSLVERMDKVGMKLRDISENAFKSLSILARHTAVFMVMSSTSVRDSTASSCHRVAEFLTLSNFFSRFHPSRWSRNNLRKTRTTVPTEMDSM